MRTSLGPNGMNKLVVNHLEKIIVSSDCATILKELEVQHPAAKILVMASEMQEKELGDNTNFVSFHESLSHNISFTLSAVVFKVVSFAGELLKLAEELLKNGLHTSEIVTGYQRAYEKTMELLPTLVVKTVQNIRDPVELKTAIKSVIATKQYGYEDLLSELVVKACLTTLPATGKNPKLNMDSVRIAKLRGGNLGQSSVVKGMVLLRDAEGLIKVILYIVANVVHTISSLYFFTFFMFSAPKMSRWPCMAAAWKHLQRKRKELSC